MILVCDKTVSERAVLVREELFKYGYPCAVTNFDGIKTVHPFKIVLSFTDVSDEALCAIGEDVPVIVIGEGFANSAVFTRVDNVREALREVRRTVHSIYDITDWKKSAFGFGLTPALFLANCFFAIYGNVIEPTKSEYMILKYLSAFCESDNYFSAEIIAKYCFPLSKTESGVASVPVHIANLNKKITAVYRERVIRARRGRGYYAIKV